METKLMAACGLDCGGCEIRRAPSDSQAAQVVVEWFRKEGWLTADEGMAEVLERKIYCCGCLGDRTVHWSADCSQCAEFPCRRLEEWATQNAGYGAALERLRGIHDRRQEDRPA